MLTKSDSIAAIATAPGQAGVAIIRISGPDSSAILQRVFRRPSQQTIRARQVHYGHVHDFQTGEVIDEVIAWLQPEPHTFTRESMAEIQCHGGEAMPRRVLSAILAAGARLAEPGEFSLRAFLNGRLDLAQAESVLDIVTARSDTAARIALFGSDGRLSQAIRDVRERIIDLLAHVTATIDFPEDDVPEMSGIARRVELLRSIVADIQRLRDSYTSGRRYREGARVAIVGRPNVGKSSLLNALARHERAIVTDIPGTTRDTIEETVNIEGVPIVLTDSAGLRESADPIEILGIARTTASLEASDVALMVIDSALPLTEEDRRIMRRLPKIPVIIVLNKSDLSSKIDQAEITDAWPNGTPPISDIVRVSARSRAGIDTLESSLRGTLHLQPARIIDSVIVTNRRHFDELERAISALIPLCGPSYDLYPPDVVASSMEEAAIALGSITGETTSQDVIATIFSRFCIGK